MTELSNEQKTALRHIIKDNLFLSEVFDSAAVIRLRGFLKKETINDDDRLFLILVLNEIVETPGKILPKIVNDAITEFSKILHSDFKTAGSALSKIEDDILAAINKDDTFGATGLGENNLAHALLSHSGTRREVAIKEFLESGSLKDVIDVENRETLELMMSSTRFFELERMQKSQSLNKVEDGNEDENNQDASGNVMTDEMLAKQAELTEINKLMDQSKYLNDQILKANQNKVLNVNPFITQEQDIIRFNRRMIESRKFQHDEFEKTLNIGIMSNAQQYLNRQQYSNYLYGIPPIKSDLKVSDEFFAK